MKFLHNRAWGHNKNLHFYPMLIFNSYIILLYFAQNAVSLNQFVCIRIGKERLVQGYSWGTQSEMLSRLGQPARLKSSLQWLNSLSVLINASGSLLWFIRTIGFMFLIVMRKTYQLIKDWCRKYSLTFVIGSQIQYQPFSIIDILKCNGII